MPKTTRLTGLLHEFEDLLDELGAPFSSYALPGIDDDMIDRVLAPDERLAPDGLVVPTELREWWRWHNGTRIDTATTDRHTFGPGRWGLSRASVALADMKRLPRDFPGQGWQPDWVPFAWKTFIEGEGRQEWSSDRAGFLVGRLDELTADELCVGLWLSSTPFPAGPVASSLAEVVDTVLEVLRDGRVVWNPDEGQWVQVSSLDRLPPYVWM